MSDDVISAIWDAIERRADDAEALEQARQERIAASREALSYYDFRDPALSVPGRIDNQRSRKGKKR